jgi:hypothetical protein
MPQCRAVRATQVQPHLGSLRICDTNSWILEGASRKLAAGQPRQGPRQRGVSCGHSAPGCPRPARPLLPPSRPPLPTGPTNGHHALRHGGGVGVVGRAVGAVGVGVQHDVEDQRHQHVGQRGRPGGREAAGQRGRDLWAGGPQSTPQAPRTEATSRHAARCCTWAPHGPARTAESGARSSSPSHLALQQVAARARGHVRHRVVAQLAHHQRRRQLGRHLRSLAATRTPPSSAARAHAASSRSSGWAAIPGRARRAGPLPAMPHGEVGGQAAHGRGAGRAGRLAGRAVVVDHGVRHGVHLGGRAGRGGGAVRWEPPHDTARHSCKP